MDGGNGPDTNYLVLATDHEEAAALVRPVDPDVAIMHDLGVCYAEVERPVILRGPYIEYCFEKGTLSPAGRGTMCTT